MDQTDRLVPPTGRSLPKRLLFAVALTLVSLALVEFVADAATAIRSLRSAQAVSIRDGKKFSSHIQEDDYLRWRFIPSQRNATINGLPVNINSLGFRGPEPTVDKTLVVCLGDSVTFGWTASADDRTYPARLASLLADRNVEVLNAGMPRWNTLDLFDLYVTRISSLHPKYVILEAGWNDIMCEFAPGRQAESAAAARPSPWSAVSSAFNSARLLSRAADAARSRLGPRAANAASGKAPAASCPVQWERLDEYQRILRAFVHGVRQDGATPVLMTLPHFLKSGMSNDERKRLGPHRINRPDIPEEDWLRLVTEINQRIRQVAADLDVPVADLEHALDSALFDDLCHPNDEGNALLAAQVARTLDFD